jgi:hypothetical protein
MPSVTIPAAIFVDRFGDPELPSGEPGWVRIDETADLGVLVSDVLELYEAQHFRTVHPARILRSVCVAAHSLAYAAVLGEEPAAVVSYTIVSDHRGVRLKARCDHCRKLHTIVAWETDDHPFHDPLTN